MFKQKKVVALLLSLVLVMSVFMGNTNLAITTQVFAAEKVAAPSNLSLEKTDAGFVVQWDSYNNAASYDVYRAESRYGVYKIIATVDSTSYVDTNPNEIKYENYYKVAVHGSNSLSEPISLEIEMFGEGMYIFSEKDDVEQVYNAVNDVYKIQGAVDGNGNATAGGQFSEGRYALAFKPGDYSNIAADNYNISYYTQILGLGELPTDVTIKNVHVPPVLGSSNVTCNFWMGIENISISKNTNGSNDIWYAFNWSVSQAAPARRLYVQRQTNLNYMWDGWASGGYIADSILEGAVGSWTQQQYYLRNNTLGGDLYGINWNLVMQGCTTPTGDNWNNTTSNYPMYELESGLGKTNWKSGGKYTVLDKTDAVREKPFLYYDENQNEYKVFAPAMRTNAKGTSWSKYGNGAGTTYDISDFYIARADRDNAASINAALAAGKNIILSPGIYHAEEPINITKANTIVLGLGLATIIPDNTETGIKIADVDGVTLAGVIVDADSYSKNMIVVGGEGSNKDHSSNPTELQDVFIRVGGVHGGVASTEQAIVINSNDVIGDHFWIWRADHGAGVGWNLNTAANGIVINGDDVTLYGLMVEHFQEYDVLWRGENGKNYFLQNEKAYDPQNQADWMSHDGTVLGYAAYKVANNVDNHYAVGMGSYDVFIYTNGASIFLENAYEVPNKEGVMIENACTVEIADGNGPIVGFNSIVNGTGPSITTGAGSGGGYARQACLLYNNGVGISIPSFYLTGGNDNASGTTIEEKGITPTDDPKAEANIVKDGEDTEEEDKQTVATGAYADWKNNAITYPAKGQLVAAGSFDIEFNRLYGATQYEVYVDDSLVKTISGTDAQAASFEVDYYSVDVAKHKVKVVATMPEGSKITSNIRTFFISKKGIGIWQDDADKVEEMNNSWYYTWSTSGLTGVSEEVEFVPMIWGDYGTSSREYWWLKNKEYLNYNHLLAFNEPDRNDQSNMSAARAVELWPLLEQASDDGVKVGSPATSSPHTLSENGGWFGEYQNLMYSADYHDDYTAVHFYFDYPGTYVLDILEDIHEDTGKPIWITEWGVAQWSQVQSFNWTGGPDQGNWQRDIIVDFLYEVLPTLDQMDFVERYAWFPFDGSDTTAFGNGAGGLFFNGSNDPLNGQLTAVGKAYKELGNPTGYNANKVAEDEVVDDGNVEAPKEEVTTQVPTTEAPTTQAPTTQAPTTEEPTVEVTTEAVTEVPTVPADAENIALGKSASASSILGGHYATNAVDGNKGSRWESEHGVDPGVLTIDLGGTYAVSGFQITWETAAAKEYQFQVSMDGTNWTTVYTVTDGVSGEVKDGAFTAIDAKYVRVYGTSRTTGYGYSIYEMEVYGKLVSEEIPTEAPTTEAPTTEAPTTEAPTVPIEKTNVVLGKAATTNSVHGLNVADYAVDGNILSRWESVHGDYGIDWLQVDLDGTYIIDSFKIIWETAAAKTYEFQVSMDGTNWTTVYTVTDGKSGETREANFAATQAKYVRVYGTTKTTGYGYSIYEMEVYGSAVDSGNNEAPTEVPTTQAPTTEAPTEIPTIDVDLSNIVTGKTATASTELGGNTAMEAIDGEAGSRWESLHIGDTPQWIQIDLEDTYVVSSFKIIWETAAAKEYKFQVSMDGINWTTVADVTDGKSGETKEGTFAATQAKYVRVYGTTRTTGYGYSIWEMEVYGYLANGVNVETPTEAPTTPAEKSNVVLNKTASTSSVYGKNEAINAVDGNGGSRWETVHGTDDAQWIMVDLGGTYTVDSFKIDWETAAAKEYQFQVSMDGTNWTTVCTVTDGKSGETREESFDATKANYIRVYGTSKTTGYGYSIWEMEVYGW